MKSWIREKKYECGEYRTVGIYAVTDQEHRQRGRKHKESSRGQKARNKNASMRRYQRKVLANFDKDGFYVTGTYEDAYRPESFEDCVQDVRNYERRVKAAVIRRFGEQRARRLKLSLHAVRNGEKGKLHMHGFAECKGLTRPSDGNSARCWKSCGGGGCRARASMSRWGPATRTGST